MSTAHLTDRAVLHVGGAEARAFLQGLLTNDLDLLSPERPLWAALLSAQGKALFDMLLYDGGHGDGAVLLDCEAARADDLARRLAMYRLRRPVTIARTDRVVSAAWNCTSDLPGDPRLPALGSRGPVEARPADASPAEYRAHRLALGVAEGAGELGVDQTLWLEANAAELHGVSFTKGCYVGQENTARMHYRANVRRRLLPVTLDAPPGDPDERAILSGERAAGELRAWEGAHGLAWLRTEYADGPLTLGGAPVRVDWPAWLPKPDPASAHAG